MAMSLRLPPLPSVRDLTKLYRLQAKKQLAQNFLMDERLTNKIVRQAGNLQGWQVLEVGPGPGGITRSIMRKLPDRIILVEKDKRFQPTLEMLTEAFSTVNGKMNVFYDDIMGFDFSKVFSEEVKREWSDKSPKIHIIGNLPFNVSTPLIIRWLHDISEKRGAWALGRVRLLLTFQKEVAERLVAPPSGAQRCRLSVMAQAWTKPKLRFVIPGRAFIPEPDVDVGVVTFDPLETPRTDHEFSFFEKVTRHLFSFRQKYSLACVKTLFPYEHQNDLGLMMFKLSDLDPTMRPIELTVEDMHRLASAYQYLLEKHPEIKDYNYRASRKVLSKCHTKEIQVEEIDDMYLTSGVDTPPQAQEMSLNK
ncbi:dimethyladenosine transferase 1, mitochondrial [Diachasma alloeum]|uniref:dimethyladenosine transferase 1, mitochondrial n=1 Tax=Diachasma alloeum TaxID=454923 RepID=UPI0007384A6D|nr:dimethyladenosine transferase 1, mitochondrial [Diachasma alloeum]